MPTVTLMVMVDDAGFNHPGFKVLDRRVCLLAGSICWRAHRACRQEWPSGRFQSADGPSCCSEGPARRGTLRRAHRARR